MSKNKKVTSTKTQSFTQVLFTVYAFLFFTIGFLLLFFTETVSLVAMIGEQVKATSVVEQFFGSFMLLLSFFLFSVRKLEGQVILNFVSALILCGFINLYLLFSLSENILLPSIYFIFQIIMQLSFFIVLFEQLKRR
jgi:hypothetical protein